MLIFIDESGDPGLSLKGSTSTHFLLVALVFEDELVAEECSLIMKKLKRTLGVSDTYEFKFNKMSKKFRIALLESTKPLNFSVISIVFDKHSKNERINSKESLYEQLLVILVRNLPPKSKNLRFRLDGKKDKSVKNMYRVVLSRSLNKGTLKDFKLIDSKINLLIQLADAIAGSIMQKVSKKDESYLKIIEEAKYISILTLSS